MKFGVYKQFKMSSEGKPLSVYEEVARMKEPGLTAEQVAQRHGEWAQGEKYDKVCQIL